MDEATTCWATVPLTKLVPEVHASVTKVPLCVGRLDDPNSHEYLAKFHRTLQFCFPCFGSIRNQTQVLIPAGELVAYSIQFCRFRAMLSVKWMMTCGWHREVLMRFNPTVTDVDLQSSIRSASYPLVVAASILYLLVWDGSDLLHLSINYFGWGRFESCPHLPVDEIGVVQHDQLVTAYQTYRKKEWRHPGDPYAIHLGPTCPE